MIPNSQHTDDFYCDFVLNHGIAVDIVQETDRVLAFHHTRPSHAFHVVLVPKQHIASLLDIEDWSLISELFRLAQEIVREQHLDERNFRIVTNGGAYQDSKHLHFHLISDNPER